MNRLRSTLLRVRNLPPETVMLILIQIPLPLLLDIFSHVSGFSRYCYDNYFWLKRAQSLYGEAAETFREFVDWDQGMSVTGFLAYLQLLSLLRSRQNDTAEQEISELSHAVIDRLRDDAKAHAQAPQEYYILKADMSPWEYEKYFGNLIKMYFPASSYSEALLDIDNYLTETRGMNFIKDSMQGEIDTILDTGAYHDCQDDFISFLAKHLLDTMSEYHNGPWIEPVLSSDLTPEDSPYTRKS
jgi:hypothetical protein